jgi:beta-lactamase class C
MSGSFFDNIKTVISAFALIGVFLGFSSFHKVQNIPFISGGLLSEKSLVDTAFNRLLDKEINAKMKTFQCPGMAVLVMRNNQVIYQKQYGSKKRNTGDPIDAETVFRLGSVSKGFAGILAAILIDKNMLHLDDPIAMYVPEVTMKAKSKDKVLRVKHVLTHSTGLTQHAYSNLVDENRDMQTIITYLNRLVPRDSTGKAYAYQNAAFGLIEKVIEKVTKMSYARALDYYLFSPLNMCNTSCTFEDIASTNNVCHGHKFGKHGFVPVDFSPHYYNVASAGGVNAPLIDMRKWLSAVMGYYPHVISPNAREIAFSPYINTSKDRKHFNRWPGFESSHYGLGWRLVNTKNNQLVYHGGLVNGFRAEIAFDKEKDLGIVILFNSLCNYSNYAVHEFYDLWNEYYKAEQEGFF